MPNRRRVPRWYFLPAAFLALVLGTAYLLGGPQRTESPSFDYAKSLAPMYVWGILFLLGAAAIITAILVNYQTGLVWALFIGGSMFAWWACCFAVSAFTDPRASLTGWAIHGFIACTFYLSSLAARVWNIT